jgi:hypothetical protein
MLNDAMEGRTWEPIETYGLRLLKKRAAYEIMHSW